MGKIHDKYLELKKKHPEALLLFRCGDFYETYGKDAEIAAKVLSITLTRSSYTTPDSYCLAGFPQHALDTYLPKLIRNSDRNGGKYGYLRVAICDELEERVKNDVITPKEALNSHRDFWVKRWQGNGYYPITHYVWLEEYKQYDDRWKKTGPFKPWDDSKKLYNSQLYVLENNPYIVSFNEMKNNSIYNNE